MPVSAVHAQSNAQGGIVGTVLGDGDATIRIKGLSSGVSITVSPDDQDKFRVSALPVGRYVVTLVRPGKPAVQKEVSVTIGGLARVTFADASDEATELGSVVVTGARIAPIEVATTESSMNISTDELGKMPVPRTINSVSLLAPGTVKGDAAFGGNVSFGGASVGENTFYFNGFNITDFREGLGFNDVPYEFIDAFQVKTGGYGAEFGRSLGGVVNMTSRRGSDQFEAGANFYWEPSSLAAKGSRASTYLDENGDRQYWYDYRTSNSDTLNANLFASGAIVPGHLYAYGLVSTKRVDSEYGGAVGTFNESSSSTPFYGLNVDYFLNQDHSINLTYFRNQEDVTRDRYYYDNDTRKTIGALGPIVYTTGGDTYIAKYTGRLTDRLSVSALYGKSELTNDTAPGNPNTCIYALDRTTGERHGCAGTGLVDRNADAREAMRLDVEYALDTHVVRAGIDYEDLTVGNADYYTGPDGDIYYYYPNHNQADDKVGLQVRHYENYGNVETTTSALYVEDTWSPLPGLAVYVGIRNEAFDNKGVTGESFFKVTDQWAPRLGISYDILGDGRSKLYANWGRYHLPVATNTNIRVGGAELYAHTEYDSYGEIGPDGAPTDPQGELNSGFYNGSDGSPKDTRQLVDQDGIGPMYQDEFMLGYQMNVAKNWNAGARFIHRELKSSLEDECFDGFVADASCALVNPGSDVTIYTAYNDTDGDGLYFEDPDPNGELHPVTLSNDVLGFPKAKRKYEAVELTLERVFDSRWSMQASYTWSQSYGNTEGYLNSDNGQTDPGITIAFDYPGLTEGNEGYLPNDRRHKFKLFGAYQLTDAFRVGANMQVYSGRPVNCFGNYPDSTAEDRGDYSAYYGSSSFYCGGELVPRGSTGRTPWTYQLDLSARYTPDMFPNLTAGLDVFNVLNASNATQINEAGEYDYQPGSVAPQYKAAERFQTPIYTRLSVEYKF